MKRCWARNTAHNTGLAKKLVHRLSDPDSYLDCASYQVQCCLIALFIEVSPNSMRQNLKGNSRTTSNH